MRRKAPVGVYNFRSEGSEFASGRCSIPVDGFYEFTESPDKKKKRKDKLLFTKSGELVLHRRHLADGQGRPRGLHHADDAAWPRHRALP